MTGQVITEVMLQFMKKAVLQFLYLETGLLEAGMGEGIRKIIKKNPFAAQSDFKKW